MGLENVVFNDFIDQELDSEDVSEQRVSASLPDSVPIESEGERAAREAGEMAALDAVGDYETLRVCVCVRARDVDVFVRICICIF